MNNHINIKTIYLHSSRKIKKGQDDILFDNNKQYWYGKIKHIGFNETKLQMQSNISINTCILFITTKYSTYSIYMINCIKGTLNDLISIVFPNKDTDIDINEYIKDNYTISKIQLFRNNTRVEQLFMKRIFYIIIIILFILGVILIKKDDFPPDYWKTINIKAILSAYGGYIIIFFVTICIFINGTPDTLNPINYIVLSNTENRCLKVYTELDKYKCKFKDIPNEYYNYRLSHFYIASSYKSYLSCTNNLALTSGDNLKYVLQKGARYIHLDIYNDGVNIPIVQHTPLSDNNTKLNNELIERELQPIYNILQLSECLEIIKKHAWNASNHSIKYPLLLYLEFHNKETTLLNNTADAINRTLKNKLLDIKYCYNGQQCTNPLSKALLSDLIGKLAILTNLSSTTGSTSMDEITNSIITTYDFNIAPNIYTPNINNNIPTIALSVEYTIKHEENGDEIISNGVFTDINHGLQYTRDYLLCYYRLILNHNTNYDFTKPLKYGTQLIAMNYQAYDEPFKKYFTTPISSSEHLPHATQWAFNDCSFLLKPSNVILPDVIEVSTTNIVKASSPNEILY
jgi:hypothetical protein